MLRFILKRLLEAVPVLFVVATLAFFLARFAPGGPFDEERALPPNVKAQLAAHYGLAKPPGEQDSPFL